MQAAGSPGPWGGKEKGRWGGKEAATCKTAALCVCREPRAQMALSSPSPTA